MESQNAFKALAFLFLVIQVMAIVRNYLTGYFNYFWFCNFVPILFALAFLFSNVHLAKALVNIGLVPQIIFIFIFVYNIFTGTEVLFVVPESADLFYNVSSIIIHLSTVIALCFTYKFKPNKETIMYSLLVLILMYSAMIAFTNSEEYTNYVYSAKTIIPFSIPYYTAIWIPLAFAIVVLPTHLLQHALYKKALAKTTNL